MKSTPEQITQSWKEIASTLGYSRNAVYAWRKLDGAPQTPDLEAWKAFVAEHDLGVVGNRASKTREGLLVEELTKENRLLDLRIAKEERRSVDRSEVDALLLHVATMQKTVLFPAMERELPPRAEGKTASEISVIGREIADRCCAVMASAIETWANNDNTP